MPSYAMEETESAPRRGGRLPADARRNGQAAGGTRHLQVGPAPPPRIGRTRWRHFAHKRREIMLAS